MTEIAGAPEILNAPANPLRASLFRRKRGDTTADKSAVNPITFGFDRKLRLSSVKVIPVSDIETNKFPHPIWHLLSESNSVPTKDFTYGASIQGMRPAVQGAIASWVGQIVLFGCTFAFFLHLCGGIRHLVWDAGYGFDLRSIYVSGWVVVATSVALTMAAWVVSLFVAG